jgi:2-polyprenyl-3-methyl-5-hydroxy-6-metoxy-1,4-benzoquinol methylase
MNQIKDKQYYEEKYYSPESIKAIYHFLDNRLHRYRIRKVLDIYKPSGNEVVVDLGCAWGTFCFAFARFAQRVIGIDFSEKAVTICRQRLETERVQGLSFFCADAQFTGIKPESIDVVIAADLVEHLYPPQFEKMLDECRRILRPKGKLVIWTPHRGHFIERMKINNLILKKDESHVDYKSMPRMVGELRKRGFGILKSNYAESHIPVLRYIEKLFLPILPLLRRRIAILAQKN